MSGLKNMIAGPTFSNQCFDNIGLKCGQRKCIFNMSLGIADLGTRGHKASDFIEYVIKAD